MEVSENDGSTPTNPDATKTLLFVDDCNIVRIKEVTGKYNLSLPRSWDSSTQGRKCNDDTLSYLARLKNTCTMRSCTFKESVSNEGSHRTLGILENVVPLMKKKFNRVESISRMNTRARILIMTIFVVGFMSITVTCLVSGSEIEKTWHDWTDETVKRSAEEECWNWEWIVEDMKENKQIQFQVLFETNNQLNIDHKTKKIASCDGVQICKSPSKAVVCGPPAFCWESTSSIPKNGVVFDNATHLVLRALGNCTTYFQLILTEWNFPKVFHVKLEYVIIGQQEFNALMVFIDKHSETLRKLEIDESYLCPSPGCDAGMINFPPDHDFEVIVTGRKPSPDSVPVPIL